MAYSLFSKTFRRPLYLILMMGAWVNLSGTLVIGADERELASSPSRSGMPLIPVGTPPSTGTGSGSQGEAALPLLHPLSLSPPLPLSPLQAASAPSPTPESKPEQEREGRAGSGCASSPLVEEVRRQLALDPTCLDVSRKNLTKESFGEVLEALTATGQITHVTTLDFSHNALDTACLSYGGLFPSLRTLGLKGTGLGTLRFFSGVHLFPPTLRQVDWRENPSFHSLDAVALWPLVQAYRPRSEPDPYPTDKEEGALYAILDEDILYKMGVYRKLAKEYDQALIYHTAGCDARNQLAGVELVMDGDWARAVPPEEAFQRFQLGYGICNDLIAQDNAEAQYLMAHLLLKPDKEARTYLQRLGRIPPAEDLVGTERVRQEAMALYQRAADQHHKSAAIAVATLYREGKLKAPLPVAGEIGIGHQLMAALKYYRIAREAGSQSVVKDIAALEAELARITEGR